MTIKAVTGDTIEGTTTIVRARVVLGETDVAIVQADLSAISYTVYDGTEQVQGETALVVADTIYDTLQTWTVDTTGYNFRAVLPSTTFTDGGGKRYKIAVKLTFSDDAVGFFWAKPWVHEIESVT
jgi:hypothetical protein